MTEEEITKRRSIKNLSITKAELLLEIKTVEKKKDKLERSVKSLKKDQELVEFELRNEQAKTTRPTGRKRFQSLYFAASTARKRKEIVNSSSLPDAVREKSMQYDFEDDFTNSKATPAASVIVRPKTHARKISAPLYCILCLTTLKSTDLGPCKIHRNVFVQGIWISCQKKREGRECHRVEHCYLAKSCDSRDVILTVDHEQSIYLS